MRELYFLVSFAVGKRNFQTCEAMTEKMFSRLDLPFPDYKIVIFSDGYEEYEKCFAKYYANTCIDPTLGTNFFVRNIFPHLAQANERFPVSRHCY